MQHCLNLSEICLCHSFADERAAMFARLGKLVLRSGISVLRFPPGNDTWGVKSAPEVAPSTVPYYIQTQNIFAQVISTYIPALLINFFSGQLEQLSNCGGFEDKGGDTAELEIYVSKEIGQPVTFRVWECTSKTLL